MSRARDLANGITTLAPLASPDFTGTVDLTGTTISLDNDQISGDKVSGGTIGAGTFNGTIGDSATFTVEHFRWTANSSFENSWEKWEWSTANQTEQGIRIRRIGPLYIVDMSIKKTGLTAGTEINEKVLEVGSNITHPTNTVLLGLGNYVSSAGTEYFLNPYINSDGHLYVRGYNSSDTIFYSHGSLIGLDVA